MCHHYPAAQKLAAQGLLDWSEIRITPDFDDLFAPAEYYPCYSVPVVRQDENDEWLLERRSWGLLHRMWKPTEKVKTAKAFQRGKINARSETIDTTWPWKFAFRQRCVLPAGGFFEPQQAGGEGLYTLPDHPAFFIAGIWDRYEGDDGKGNTIAVDSCVMLTTDANALVESTRKGRPRQPVIFTTQEQVEAYCSLEVTEHNQIAHLLTPLSDNEMQLAT